jgi:hypothetical protein
MTFTGGNKITVIKYLQTLVEDNCKNFAKVIMRMREKSQRRGNWIYNLTEYDKVYDLKKFKILASKFQDDKSLAPEEREAIKLFIETPYETDEVAIKKQNTEPVEKKSTKKKAAVKKKPAKKKAVKKKRT